MKSNLLKAILACLLLTTVATGQNKKQKPFDFQKTAQKITGPANTTTVSNVYSFSTFTAAYVPIGGANLTGGLKWDDLDYSVPLGFNFTLYGQTTSTLNLFEARLLSPNDINNDPYWTSIMPIFEDLCDRAYDPNVDNEGDPGGISTISYTTTGTPGNRICKIQVSNAGFYEENNNGPSVSNLNFQTWVYETSNTIEIHYGIMSIQNAATNLINGSNGFVVGLADSIDVNASSSPRSNMLNGNSTSPTVVAWTTSLTSAVTPNVGNGRVYRFTNLGGSVGLIEQNTSSQINIYPSPAKDMLSVNLNNEPSEVLTARIYNQLGQVVAEQSITGANTSLNIASLTAGVYLIKVTNRSEQIVSKRFIKE